VVVDGGAYVGHYTLVAARAAGPRGRVFSFEPHPRTFHCLQRNVRENGFSERVYVRRECLGDMGGLGRFHLARGDGSESSVFVPRAPAGSRVAVFTTLDDAIGRVPSVDVMKLDLEGGEVQALRGMSWTLARSPGISVFVEYDPGALHRAQLPPERLLNQLGELGFEIQVIDETERRLAPLDALEAVAEGADQVNLYCRGPEAG
jgi:FkbM family methyltransferase